MTKLAVGYSIGWLCCEESTLVAKVPLTVVCLSNFLLMFFCLFTSSDLTAVIVIISDIHPGAPTVENAISKSTARNQKESKCWAKRLAHEQNYDRTYPTSSIKHNDESFLRKNLSNQWRVQALDKLPDRCEARNERCCILTLCMRKQWNLRLLIQISADFDETSICCDDRQSREMKMTDKPNYILSQGIWTDCNALLLSSGCLAEGPLGQRWDTSDTSPLSLFILSFISICWTLCTIWIFQSSSAEKREPQRSGRLRQSLLKVVA